MLMRIISAETEKYEEEYHQLPSYADVSEHRWAAEAVEKEVEKGDGDDCMRRFWEDKRLQKGMLCMNHLPILPNYMYPRD